MSYCVHSLTSQVFDPLIPNLSSGFPLVTPPKSLSTKKAVTTSCFSPIWLTFCNNQCNKLVTITKLNTKLIFIFILYVLLIHLSGWMLHTKTPSYKPRLSEHITAAHLSGNGLLYVRSISWNATIWYRNSYKKLLYNFNIHLHLAILTTTLHKDLNDSELKSKHMLVLTVWVHMLIFIY